MADCDLCGRPQSDTAHVCARCAGRTRDALCRLAELAPELEVTIARQGRTGDGGTGADRHPLPVDLGAAEQAWAVANAVATWARHCAETRGVEPPECGPGREVIAPAAAWLAGQLEWLRHQPEAGEAVDELGDAAILAVRIVDRRTARWYAGPCGAQIAHAPADPTAGGLEGPGEGDRVGVCSADLYAAPGASLIVCRACGARHDAGGRRDWLLDVAQDQLWHAEMIGRALAALGVPVDGARIRTWASRGLVTARGERTVDGRQRPVYRLGDVVDLATQMLARQSGQAA